MEEGGERDCSSGGPPGLWQPLDGAKVWSCANNPSLLFITARFAVRSSLAVVNTTLQWDMFPQISKGVLQHWWVEQYSIAGPDFFFSVSLWELWHRLIRAQGTEHTVLSVQRQECGAMIGNDPMFQPPPRPWQDISRDLSFSSDQELQAAIDHVESHQPLNLAQCLLRKGKERNEAAAVEILLPLWHYDMMTDGLLLSLIPKTKGSNL